MKTCTTHHFACDCREALFEDAMKVNRGLRDLVFSGKDRLEGVVGRPLADCEVLLVRKILWSVVKEKDPCSSYKPPAVPLTECPSCHGSHGKTPEEMGYHCDRENLPE